MGRAGHGAERLPAVHAGAHEDTRGDGLERAPQAVGVLHHHQRAVHDDPGEGDRAGPRRHHDRTEVRGEVDAAVPGEPRAVRTVERADHLDRFGERGAPRVEPLHRGRRGRGRFPRAGHARGRGRGRRRADEADERDEAEQGERDRAQGGRGAPTGPRSAPA
jgi:hypothetical protein